MEVILIISTLTLFLLLLSTPCESLQIKILSPPYGREGNDKKLVLPLLTRKLRFVNGETTVNKDGGQDYPLSHAHDHRTHISGVEYNKEEQMDKKYKHLNGGRWTEGSTDTSLYYTMDYTPVRRRRPIHNKSLPVAP